MFISQVQDFGRLRLGMSPIYSEATARRYIHYLLLVFLLVSLRHLSSAFLSRNDCDVLNGEH